ncbi:MAG: GyrI-like domain-containing protein [Proteobacteria bacterium]|nr:GyrI-like domain-containing protein [Pseudomonadota bacterium]
MSITPCVKTLDPQYYVGIRRVAKQQDLKAAYAEILPRVFHWLNERGVTATSPPLTVYHFVNQETGDFDVQPGFLVAEAMQGEGDIGCGQTAGGEVLCATHVGPYTGLAETWQALFAHAKTIRRPVTRSSWEIYMSNPDKVAPEKLRTDIFVPIDPPPVS